MTRAPRELRASPLATERCATCGALALGVRIDGTAYCSKHGLEPLKAWLAARSGQPLSEPLVT